MIALQAKLYIIDALIKIENTIILAKSYTQAKEYLDRIKLKEIIRDYEITSWKPVLSIEKYSIIDLIKED